MKVYILLVRRSILDFKVDPYIDRVYSSEEKVWNRIEEKIYTCFETVKKQGYKIKCVEFRNKELIFDYENSTGDLYGSIRYEIQERVVDSDVDSYPN